jgi:peptide deformylase
MSIRPVLLFGDPRLRQKAAEVTLESGTWRGDAEDLADTLRDLKARLGFGRALAAPQIGSPHRLIAFACPLGSFVAVNPRILWRSPELVPIWDDCFSLPGTAMAVMRHRSVSFECHDVAGKRLSFEAVEPTHAELVQHEVDHLDGILMVDRLVEPTAVIARQMAAVTPHPRAAG